MSYNIFSSTAPAMPKPSKGTEFVKFAISQASKDMREVLIPMAIPALAAHLTDVRFMYSDNKFYEMCGQMGHLIGPSGIGKAQLGHLVEAIMRNFRKHDETEFKKLVDWQRQMKTKGANKEKPERPDVSFWFPPADVTNPAFIQNAMACEKLGERTQYLNLPEVEMADRICGGHKQVSQMVRNIFDCQRAGALRATARGERSGRIPRQGSYDEDFLKKLDSYLLRLDNCKGTFVVKQLNKVADQLAEEMARLADLADDDTLWELSHRSIFSAWKKGAVLWILNDQTWTRSIGEFVVWFCYYDLWSKVKVFGDMFKGYDAQEEEVQRSGPKNMLDSLEHSFNEQQLEALRLSLGKSKEGTKHQLYVWKNRKFITYSNQTGLYTKTQEYLTGTPDAKVKSEMK